MENEDVIRLQMEDTRTALTEKLETLEDKLMNTVQETKAAVDETVASVKETVVGTVQETRSAVKETVASVKDTMHESVEGVKDMMDVSAHVDRHPWLSVGGAVLCGYILGSLIPGGQGPRSERRVVASPAVPRPQYGNGDARHTYQKPQAVAETPTTSSWLSSFDPELQKLKGMAVGAALGMVRDMITEAVPPQMVDQVRTLVDDVTRKVGGEPVPSSTFSESMMGQEKPRF
jgi:ElaB/YqjD/DUF883 family membrane-anchored ribosome-binding protein